MKIRKLRDLLLGMQTKSDENKCEPDKLELNAEETYRGKPPVPTRQLGIQQDTPSVQTMRPEIRMDKGKSPASERVSDLEFVSPYEYSRIAVDTPVCELEIITHNLVFSINDKRHIMYVSGDFMLRQEDFASLASGTYILNGIIDVVSLILNSDNERRRPNSHRRYFFSTTIYMCLTGQLKNELGMERKPVDEAANQLINEFQRNGFKKNDVWGFDMFFIPIVAHEHCYVLVVDYRKKVNWLLDNRPVPREDCDPLDKYGTVLLDLIQSVNIFVRYCNDFIVKRPNATSFDLRVVDMSWKANKNNVDCGVYSMVHMELFDGELKIWNTGLEMDNFDQMEKLRMKYMCKILLHHTNEMKDYVVDMVKKYVSAAH